MTSSLYQDQISGPIQNAVRIYRQIVGNNPDAAITLLYQTNPAFRQFADTMKNKTPQQAFGENGHDYSCRQCTSNIGFGAVSQSCPNPSLHGSEPELLHFNVRMLVGD